MVSIFRESYLYLCLLKWLKQINFCKQYDSLETELIKVRLGYGLINSKIVFLECKDSFEYLYHLGINTNMLTSSSFHSLYNSGRKKRIPKGFFTFEIRTFFCVLGRTIGRVLKNKHNSPYSICILKAQVQESLANILLH